MQLLNTNKRKMLSDATSVGNKQKQVEDRRMFFISNIVAIMSYLSNKSDQNEFHAIKDLLQCSISSTSLCGSAEVTPTGAGIRAAGHPRERQCVLAGRGGYRKGVPPGTFCGGRGRGPREGNHPLASGWCHFVKT